jgi:hypothetical protein
VPDAHEPGEAAALAAASQRGRRLDRELAQALGIPEPAAEPLAEAYYDALVRRIDEEPGRHGEEVAAQLGLGPERVQRIAERARGKLRAAARRRGAAV